MKKVVLILLASPLLLFSVSFDCKKANNYAQKEICKDNLLSKLDDKINSIYTNFYLITNEIKSDQIKWIKKVNHCKNNTCIKNLYETRIEDLNTSLENQKTFPKLYLDAMREAQKQKATNPEVIIIFGNSYMPNKKPQQEYMGNLFRFKDIKIRKPIIKKVKYDDPKLKNLLGICWFYGFNQDIRKRYDDIWEGHRHYINDYKVKETIKNTRISVWKIYTHNKEWLFIQKSYTDIGGGHGFLLNTNVCKKKKLDNGIIDALDYRPNEVREAFGFDHPNVAIYKGKEYVFDLTWIDNTYITFELHDIWENSSFDPRPVVKGLMYDVEYRKKNLFQ